MHPFDDATRLEPLADSRFKGRTSPAYANMVGPFGGVTAACLLNAPMQHPQRIGEPVAVTVNFAAPLADGEFEIVARPLRTNRSTQHWAIELTQNGEVASSATAVFAVRRPGWSALETSPPADVRRPDDIVRTGTVDRLAWTDRYDMRFVSGSLPDPLIGEAQPGSSTRVWLRDEPPRPLDFPALASLCDAFFPRVMLRRGKLMPIGTVSMTTYFHADAEMLRHESARHLLGTARGVNFRHGYYDQSAEMWSADGPLLASSHQIVYYRD